MVVNQKKIEEASRLVSVSLSSLYSPTTVCLRATLLILQFKSRMSWLSASRVCKLATLPRDLMLQPQASFSFYIYPPIQVKDRPQQICVDSRCSHEHVSCQRDDAIRGSLKPATVAC